MRVKATSIYFTLDCKRCDVVTFYLEGNLKVKEAKVNEEEEVKEEIN